jgi:sortase B
MNLINVDFNELKKINKDIKGWIQVNGTNINYPFVQSSDNDYYLNHSIDKSYNSAGWVFLDYRNKLDTIDKNTIIYAHGRLDKTMFGSLKNVLTSDWQNNSNNHIVKISTEYENSLWQVFSVYKIPTTTDYLITNFNSNSKFKSFTDMLINRSEYNFNTTVNEDDKIITLSTCYNNNEKVVLHAKLIKKEIR